MKRAAAVDRAASKFVRNMSLYRIYLSDEGAAGRLKPLQLVGARRATNLRIFLAMSALRAGSSSDRNLGQTAELDALLGNYPKVDVHYEIDIETGMLTLPPSGSWVMPAVSEVPATASEAWCSFYRDLIS
jgi:hypothetical protein